jgi:hypothetical protein
MAHTPGPWEVCKFHFRKNGIKMHRLAVKETNTGCFIVDKVFTTRFKEGDETEANAALIAAAPDLLEACKVALSVLIREGASEFHAQPLLRDAIIKADPAP